MNSSETPSRGHTHIVDYAKNNYSIGDNQRVSPESPIQIKLAFAAIHYGHNFNDFVNASIAANSGSTDLSRWNRDKLYDESQKIWDWASTKYNSVDWNFRKSGVTEFQISKLPDQFNSNASLVRSIFKRRMNHIVYDICFEHYSKKVYERRKKGQKVIYDTTQSKKYIKPTKVLIAEILGQFIYDFTNEKRPKFNGPVSEKARVALAAGTTFSNKWIKLLKEYYKDDPNISKTDMKLLLKTTLDYLQNTGIIQMIHNYCNIGMYKYCRQFVFSLYQSIHSIIEVANRFKYIDNTESMLYNNTLLIKRIYLYVLNYITDITGLEYNSDKFMFMLAKKLFYYDRYEDVMLTVRATPTIHNEILDSCDWEDLWGSNKMVTNHIEVIKKVRKPRKRPKLSMW
jgi:hypothetical protein